MTTRTASILALAGGVLMAVGSLLPWITVRTGLGSISASGTDGDGIATLVIGALAALVAVVHLDRPIGRALKVGLILGGLIGLAVTVVDFAEVSRRATAAGDVAAVSVGPGLFVLGVGSAVLIAGAWRMASGLPSSASVPGGTADELARLQAARDGGLLTAEEYQQAAAALAVASTPPATNQAGSNMQCGRCGKPLSPAWKGKCEHCKATYAEFPPVPRTT